MRTRKEIEHGWINNTETPAIIIELLLDIRERLAISNQHTTALVERLNKIEGFIYRTIDGDK